MCLKRRRQRPVLGDQLGEISHAVDAVVALQGVDVENEDIALGPAHQADAGVRPSLEVARDLDWVGGRAPLAAAVLL